MQVFHTSELPQHFGPNHILRVIIVDLFISNSIFSTSFFAPVAGREMALQRYSCPNLPQTKNMLGYMKKDN